MATPRWNVDSQPRNSTQQRAVPSASEQHGDQVVRIIMTDDHNIILEGLQLSLEAAGMKVLATAQNGRQTLELLEQAQPDVLLTDLNMPGMSGIELLRRLRQKPRPFKIVILTGEANAHWLGEARALEVDGFLSKDLSSDKLAEAVRQIAAGERIYLLSNYEQGKYSPEPAQTASEASLTDQEQEVLRLLAQALDNQEIAKALVISENTVKSHVSSVLAKLGVANRTQAALWALRHHDGSKLL